MRFEGQSGNNGESVEATKSNISHDLKENCAKFSNAIYVGMTATANRWIFEDIQKYLKIFEGQSDHNVTEGNQQTYDVTGAASIPPS